jgi:hypothetical protein
MAIDTLPIESRESKPVPLSWGLVGVAKDFGVVVSLIWFMWFAMTAALPGLLKEFRAEVQAQRLHDEKRTLEFAVIVRDLGKEVKDMGKELVAEIRRLKEKHE